MTLIVDLSTLLPVLVAALLVGAATAIALERVSATLRRRKWEAFNRPRPNGERSSNANAFAPDGPKPVADAVPRPPTDAADQLRIVMSASFSPQPLLNKSEARVYRELDAIVTSCNPRWLVMAQVSLGEILRGEDSAAHSCINSKRVDLLLVDEDCHPRHVIEYQGAGHHHKAAAARDAVKKEALRRAGIGYHEVIAGQTTPFELKRLVLKLVESPPFGRDQSASAGRVANHQRGSKP